MPSAAMKCLGPKPAGPVFALGSLDSDDGTLPRGAQDAGRGIGGRAGGLTPMYMDLYKSE